MTETMHKKQVEAIKLPTPTERLASSSQLLPTPSTFLKNIELPTPAPILSTRDEFPANPFETHFADPNAAVLAEMPGRLSHRSDSMHLLTAATALDRQLHVEIASESNAKTASSKARGKTKATKAASPADTRSRKRSANSDVAAPAEGSSDYVVFPNHSTPDATSTTSPSQGEEDDPSDPTAKRRKFLERNRIAAQLCRQRKKEKLERLKHSVDFLERMQQDLSHYLSLLKEENLYIRTLLLQSRDCPVMQQPHVAEHYEKINRPNYRYQVPNLETGGGAPIPNVQAMQKRAPR